MSHYPIRVSANGAVRLGPDVVCDGFARDCPLRIQTHIHTDHLADFDRSKGYQDILLTDATKRLLINERNEDLGYRQNLKVLPTLTPRATPNGSVLTVSSGHMLGAVQVAVTYNDGLRLGYSSDFSWPLDNVVGVDALVIDSTCGSPKSTRKYSQEEVESKLRELVVSRRNLGPLHVRAHRGTLQRALQVLSLGIALPFVAHKRLCEEAQIYRDNGYIFDDVFDAESEEGQNVIKSGAYIRFYGTSDRLPTDPTCQTAIQLSAFGLAGEDPVLQYTPNAYRVALSDHADFQGTLDFVRATDAKYVMTDNSRGGNAITLAQEIRHRLGIEAYASVNDTSKEWGI